MDLFDHNIQVVLKVQLNYNRESRMVNISEKIILEEDRSKNNAKLWKTY